MQNLSDDWWIDAVETDTIHAMSIDGESKFWSSDFVPPPPRPEFLKDEITTDGVTTCDMCTWAWKYSSKMESLSGREFGWIGTLIAVSLLSALTGAIVMITIIRCKIKLKNAFHSSGIACFQRNGDRNDATVQLSNRTTNGRNSKPVENDYQLPDEKRERYKRVRPWTWLSKKSTAAPSQLRSLAPSAPDNHYTFEESYPNNGEALYAELDQETGNDPAYQNAAYTGTEGNSDFQLSSVSSGPYYSQLSDPLTNRTYETVCLPEKDASWEDLQYSPRVKRYKTKKPITVPSDYI